MTNEEILNLTEVILEEEDEILVPLFKLHELILMEKESWNLELDYLTDLLKNDPRFRIIDSKSTLEPWPESDEEKMRTLGFYSGPRIMLVSKTVDQEEFYQEIVEKMQLTLDALKQAYKINPDEVDDETEMEFLQIMNKVKDLQKKLDDENK